MDKAPNTDDLQVHRVYTADISTTTETKVDQNLQVFKVSPKATHFDLPRDFFSLTSEEIKKEQKQR